jgi:hypothetical protein
LAVLLAPLVPAIALRQPSIEGLPDGIYSVKLQRNSREIRVYHSGDVYFAIRKVGKHIVGMPFSRNTDADFPYWIRHCIDGKIIEDKIIGSEVSVQWSQIYLEPIREAPENTWSGSESLSARITRERVYDSKQSPENPKIFAVITSYDRITLKIPSITSFSKIPSSQVPSSCKALAKNPFSESIIIPYSYMMKPLSFFVT